MTEKVISVNSTCHQHPPSWSIQRRSTKMSSSPRAPPPRSGKRNQRGGRGGSANARGGGAVNAKANHNHQDASNKEATTAASTSPSASPQIDADPTEESSSSLTEMPTKPNRASKNAERRAARRASNQSSTNNSPKIKSPSQNQDQTDKDSLSPSNSRDALTSSPNSNGFHSSPPSPQPSQESPQTTIGAFGGWLSNRIMGGTPTSPGAEEGEGEQEGTMTTTTKMQRSDSVSINSEAGESSAAYSASEVDGFEDAEDGDQVESVAGEAVEIDKEQEKQEASPEIAGAEKEDQVESVIASRKRQSTAKGDEDVAINSEKQVEENSSKKEESDEQPAISRDSTSISNQVDRPQTPSSTEPSELVSEEILQSTPSTSQRESASGTSINSSAPSASNSNSPSANSTSVDESVKNLDLVEPNIEASDALKTPMQPRTLLHQATPTRSRGGEEEEDLPTRLSEEGSIRGSTMVETSSNLPPSKPSSLASVDIKDRMSFEDDDEGEGVDRNSGQSFNVNESRQSHRNSDASSQRSIPQAGGGEGMLSPTLSNAGPVSPGGSATSPGGTKRSFWGLLRSPSNSPATPASTIPSGRGGGGGGIQRAFSLSSEGGGSGSENGGNGLLSPTTPTVGSTGRGSISSITTSNTPSISRTSRAPSFSPMSSFSSFAASISAARAAALGSNAASTSTSSESKPKVRLPRRQVDEMKIAEDAMRFIDARDILHSEKDATKIRELATRLEEGWREKVSK